MKKFFSILAVLITAAVLVVAGACAGESEREDVPQTNMSVQEQAVGGELSETVGNTKSELKNDVDSLIGADGIAAVRRSCRERPRLSGALPLFVRLTACARLPPPVARHPSPVTRHPLPVACCLSSARRPPWVSRRAFRLPFAGRAARRKGLLHRCNKFPAGSFI